MIYRYLTCFLILLFAYSISAVAQEQEKQADGQKIEELKRPELYRGFIRFFPVSLFNRLVENDQMRKSLDERAPLGVWVNAVEEYSQKREKIEKLHRLQNEIFEELSLMRPTTVNDSSEIDYSSRGRVSQLLQAAQENEVELQALSRDLRSRLSQVVQVVPAVRRDLQTLSKFVNSLAEKTNKNSSDQKMRQQARVIYEIKRRISDAEVLLTQVQKTPEKGVDLLMQELHAFVPRSSTRGAMTPILERLEEKLERLERSQRFLQWRLANDEREIESLRRLLEKIKENQSAEDEALKNDPLFNPVETVNEID